MSPNPKPVEIIVALEDDNIVSRRGKKCQCRFHIHDQIAISGPGDEYVVVVISPDGWNKLF